MVELSISEIQKILHTPLRIWRVMIGRLRIIVEQREKYNMIKNFIISIQNFFKNFFILQNYSSCYDHMESIGYAIFGCCGGIAGGTRSTEYLSEMCIGCPYFTEIDIKYMKKEKGLNR